MAANASILTQPPTRHPMLIAKLFQLLFSHRNKCSSSTCFHIVDGVVTTCFLMHLVVKLPLKKDSTGCK